MAKPRIFISSTYYDLKHIRSSLENFVESLGYEPVLSENGDIPYIPDMALDQACYREVGSVDVFVLIIGGRYGTEAGGEDKKVKHKFFDEFESVTKKEYEAAVSKNIPIYILIEKNVYAEYYTYQKNKKKTDVGYAHVDSVNVFNLIEDIISQQMNNPIQSFDKYSEIESWLRDQWAGLFKDFLIRRTNSQQIESLSSQVNELKENNKTMKLYLESVMTKVIPDKSAKLIESEKIRSEKWLLNEEIKKNYWYKYLVAFGGLLGKRIKINDFINWVSEADSFSEFSKSVNNYFNNKMPEEDIILITIIQPETKTYYNDLRKLLGLKPWRIFK